MVQGVYIRATAACYEEETDTTHHRGYTGTYQGGQPSVPQMETWACRIVASWKGQIHESGHCKNSDRSYKIRDREAMSVAV